MPDIDTDLFETADLIETKCATISGFDTLRIVVNRDKDLEAEINKGIGKGEGGVLIIDIQDGDPTEPGSLSLDNDYLLSIWTIPLLRKEAGKPLASTLLVSLIRALNHFKPRERANPMARLEFTGWAKTPSKTYNILAATFRLKEHL
ncbi:MAG: hypothetical protein ACQKBU_04500 [Verrucomicrobiales bacterium]